MLYISRTAFLLIVIALLSGACTDAPKPLPRGPVSHCVKNPAFLKKYGLSPPVYIDLRQKGRKGLVIREASANGKALQLPSWDDAGTLGVYSADNQGHIYISPMPFVSLYESPLSLQNILYRVDAFTGKMDSFMMIPYRKPPSTSNPFGVTGLTFDCQTELLYVSSVAGSSADQELGAIYAIAPEDKTVKDKLLQVDAMALCVFNTGTQKRLYFGLARKPEVYSIELTSDGRYRGTSRFEFSLANIKGGGFDNAQHISIDRNHIMTITGLEFNYTLMAASDPMRNIYRFRFDPKIEKWINIDVKKEG